MGLIGTFWRFSFFVPNLISMMGLAVGIDYSLFIVSRYREERARGRDNLEAIGRSGATANRAVFFSGLTVVLALAGMLLVPTTIFRGSRRRRHPGSPRLDRAVDDAAARPDGDVRRPSGQAGPRLRPRPHAGARASGWFWDRATRVVMGRPVLWSGPGVHFMIALSIPYWAQKHPTTMGAGSRPGSPASRRSPTAIQTKTAFEV